MRFLALTLCWIGSACAQAAAWVPVGPGDGGHRIYREWPQYGSVATHPAVGDHAVVLVGIPGLPRPFVTFDGGATWKTSPTFDNESFGPVVLSGTPTVMFLFDKALRSIDLGRSWAPVPLPPRPAGLTLAYGPAKLRAVNPTKPDEMVATGYSSIFHTVDGGQSWTRESDHSSVALLTVDWHARRIYVLNGSRPLDAPGPWVNGPSPFSIGHASVRSAARGVLLAFHPRSYDTPFSTTAHKLYRSTDGGATLQEVGGWAEVPYLCEIVFSASPATSVYASECETGRVHRSEDDGETWKQGPDQGDGFFGSLAIDALDPDRVYAVSTRGLLVSQDRGREFAHLDRATGAPGESRSLFFDATSPSRHGARCTPATSARCIGRSMEARPGTWSTRATRWSARVARAAIPSSVSRRGTRFPICASRSAPTAAWPGRPRSTWTATGPLRRSVRSRSDKRRDSCSWRPGVSMSRIPGPAGSTGRPTMATRSPSVRRLRSESRSWPRRRPGRFASTRRGMSASTRRYNCSNRTTRR